MKGITFGTYHSYDDFNLLLTSKEVAAPKVKTIEIDVPGADGALDLTEFFGEPKYENVTHKFKFSTIVPQSEFLTLFSTIKNAIHGKKMRIILDDDPHFYYVGRCFVSSFTNEKNIGKIAVECDCEPYKHGLASKAVYLCGENLLNLDAGTPTTENTWNKTETGYTFTRGTASGGSFMYWIVPVERGKQYTFSADYTKTTRLLYVYKDRLYGTLVAKATSGEPAIITAEETGLYVFGLYVVSGETDGTFGNVMLREGAAVGSFVPYDPATKTVNTVFTNGRIPTVPTAYTTNAVTMESDSVFVTLKKGKQLVDDFTFQKGDNSFTFKGNGVVVIEWEVGVL